MAQVFYGGGREYNALVYGEKTPEMLGIIEQGLERFRQEVGEIGQQFYQQAVGYYEQFNGSEAMRRARMVRNKVRGLFRPDIIRDMTDIGDMQQAGPVGRRWLMANPNAYERFEKQSMSAWGGKWVDYEPGTPPLLKAEYRMVNDGLVHDVEDNEEYGWKVTFHMDDFQPGDKKLDTDQKDTIVNNWARFDAMLALGEEDPSDEYGDSL